MKRKQLDETERNAIIQLRDQNLVIDAGAGTGKTTLIVDRLLDLVAPGRRGIEPLPMDRIAVITFTRRAAGELRFRIRSAMLKTLGACAFGGDRHRQLQEALSQIDAAFIGTIHSFADRLLRMRPIEAHLSPQYEILEDSTSLAEETFRLLVQVAEAGTLAAEVSAPLKELAAETQATLRDFRQAGIRSVTRQQEYGSQVGLDQFVRQVIEHRDVKPHVSPVVAEPDVDDVLAEIQAYGDAVNALTGSGRGQAWLRGRRDELNRVFECKDRSPLAVLRIIQRSLESKPSGGLHEYDFDKEKAGWELWKAFWAGATVKKVKVPAAIDTMIRPLHNWLGQRLVKAVPVILYLYEKVKARHEVVDYLDLLVKLRDLLRVPQHHEFYRTLFAHILVDEFQDTDPLQAEILLHLTSETLPTSPDEKPKPAPGRLTIVGDPKQSIYRFRRADIAAYHDFCTHLSDAEKHSLDINFRSTSSLIEFFNAQLSGLLGQKGAEVFDPVTGKAFYRALSSSFEAEAEDSPLAVHKLQYPAPTDQRETDRPAEANALAKHLRVLKDSGEFRVRDMDMDKASLRPLRFGDIAVLARSTWHLPDLFDSLNRYGIPYSARGGTLFLQEPLVRQFNLALRALADPDDGVAQTALYMPPFFASDPGRSYAKNDEHAHQVVEDLRKRRFTRPPVATALDLLYQTGFARALALMPNGEQKLDSVRHMVNALDQMAQSSGLSYDATTEQLREWVETPEQMDVPLPLDRDAVQVLTIHQAKGLEFPVVVIWDRSVRLAAKKETIPWLVSRDGRRWSIGLDGFRAGSADPRPTAADTEVLGDLADTEHTFENAERLRLYYVAATRARDLLIIPELIDGKPEDHETFVCAKLLHPSDGKQEMFDRLVRTVTASGTQAIEELPKYAQPEEDQRLAQCLQKAEQQWPQVVSPLMRHRFVPVAFSNAAKSQREQKTETEESDEQGAGLEVSRFGPAFGRTVHRALGRLMLGLSDTAHDAVAHAAKVEGLTERLDDARQDVERAIQALEAEGILNEQVHPLPEYPLCCSPDEGTLLVGSADLVAKGDGRTWLIDFKTDQPGQISDYPQYGEQVRLYARALSEAGISPLSDIRAGLLFTANGNFEWVQAAQTAI